MLSVYFYTILDATCYTLKTRVKFSKVQRPVLAAPVLPVYEKNPSFSIQVRVASGYPKPPEGSRYQRIRIFPLDRIDIETLTEGVPPNWIEHKIVRRTTSVNKWHDIKIEAKKDKFAFYIDGELITEYIDSTAPNGTVRFFANWGIVAHLDYVVITGDDVPDVSLSVTPKAKLTTTLDYIPHHPRLNYPPSTPQKLTGAVSNRMPPSTHFVKDWKKMLHSCFR